MAKLNQPFTVGKWITRRGSEGDFVREWEVFAKWTARNQPGAGIGYLLQSKDRPEEFLSFGPWDDVEAIKAWRDRPEFKAFLSTAQRLCEEFQPQSLVLVASSE